MLSLANALGEIWLVLDSTGSIVATTDSFSSNMMVHDLVRICLRVMSSILKDAQRCCLMWLSSPAHGIYFSGNFSRTSRASLRSSAKNSSRVVTLYSFQMPQKNQKADIRVHLTWSTSTLCSLLSCLYMASALAFNCRDRIVLILENHTAHRVEYQTACLMSK